MCIRVFIATGSIVEPTPPFEGRPPALSLCPLDPALAETLALAGAHVVEAGSHTGCACGFAASMVAWATGSTRRSELGDLEGALTDEERVELDLSQASRDALSSVIAAALGAGPVRIYACWWGDEAEPAVGSRTIALAEIADALDPFEKCVLFEVTP